eukprot:TRINITY_DN10723_c0_g1_i3.p1 TRINITY_DN10723_c0_g1~~TRINITY_DN10723_c0_g1_i3.p1  ORF type:complete len:569 (+),score=161.34 TRINITY_DN10723_c0_g1_i3:145-1851(+)
MAFLPGLKKQINKANQFMSEKITGVEGTKLDDDFHTMERKTEVMNELVEDLQIKTKEYLQPNPTVRAKMAAVKGISKLSGQAKASTYPQPEGTLGDAMTTFGNKMLDFDNRSVFGGALVETGESLKQMADLKYALDDNVKQNFLEPLHQLQNKDLKEVAHHRKKLQGRKLDYDCKKRRVQGGGAVPDKEIKMAEDKFAESLHLAQMGMYNIMENDVEQISQLVQFADALLEYHKQCADVLQSLTDTLYTKTNDATGRPKRDFTPKTLEDLGVEVSGEMPAPMTERSMRPASANRSSRSSGVTSGARSASSTPSPYTSSAASGQHQPRPTSQPSFTHQQQQQPPQPPAYNIANLLDPWESAEISARLAPPPGNQQHASSSAHYQPSAPPTSNSSSYSSYNSNNNNSTSNKSSTGWTTFPETTNSVWNKNTTVIPPSRSAPGIPQQQQNQGLNNNVNGYKSSNLPVSSTLISPALSPAGTPTHQQKSWTSSGYGEGSTSVSPATSPMRSNQPSCQALYDFEAENGNELGFKEGDIIILKQKLDENWFEGSLNGKTGCFPINYVNVLVNLP